MGFSRRRLLGAGAAGLLGAFRRGAAQSPPRRSTYSITSFDDGRSGGWLPGFSDFTLETASTNRVAEVRALPEELRSRYGYYMRGRDTSDDLFMFIKNAVTGLEPDTPYGVSFYIEFASAAPSNCVGIGGAPGESVWLKAGASSVEPVATLRDQNIRLNVDKGGQSAGGTNAVVTGNIANGIPCEEATGRFVLLNRTAQLPNPVRTDLSGTLWTFVGTIRDSKAPPRFTMRSSQFCSRWRVERAARAALVLAASAAAQIGGGPQRLTVVNSATLNAGEALAPLTLATVFGRFQGVNAERAAVAPLPTTLGNAQVLVNGSAAPLLYASASQINFLIPAATVTGSAQIAVTIGGQPTGETTVAIEESSPALFVSSSEAARPAVAINADGSEHSQSNPAQRGTRVTLFATGLGRSATREDVGAMLRLRRVDASAIAADAVVPALWRIQVPVPGDLESGQAPAAVYTSGAGSNTVSVWIR